MNGRISEAALLDALPEAVDDAIPSRQVARRLGLENASARALGRRLGELAARGKLNRVWPGNGRSRGSTVWLYYRGTGSGDGDNGHHERRSAAPAVYREQPPLPAEPDSRMIALQVVIDMYERVCPRTAALLRADLHHPERMLALLNSKKMPRITER